MQRSGFIHKLAVLISLMAVSCVTANSNNIRQPISYQFAGSISFEYDAFSDLACQNADANGIPPTLRNALSTGLHQLAPADPSIQHACVKRESIFADEIGWVRYYCSPDETRFYFEARYASEAACLQEQDGIAVIATHPFYCKAVRDRKPNDKGPVATIARCPSGTRLPPFTWPPSPSQNWVVERECPDSQMIYGTQATHSAANSKKCTTIYEGAQCCGELIPQKALRLGSCASYKTSDSIFPTRVACAPDRQSYLRFFFEGPSEECKGDSEQQAQKVLAVQSSMFEFRQLRHIECPDEQTMGAKKLVEMLKSPAFLENMLLITSTPCSKPFHSNGYFSAWRFDSIVVLFFADIAMVKIGRPELVPPLPENALSDNAVDVARHVIKVWYEDNEEGEHELLTVSKCKEDGSYRVTPQALEDGRTSTFGRYLRRLPPSIRPVFFILFLLICTIGLCCFAVCLCAYRSNVFSRVTAAAASLWESASSRDGNHLEEGHADTKKIEQLALLDSSLRFRAAIR